MKLASGIAWNAVNTAITQACGFIRLIVVAAAVGPEGIGRIAIAASLIAGLNILTFFGFRQLYISGRLETHHTSQEVITDTVWCGNVFISLIVVLLAFPIGLAFDTVTTGPPNALLVCALAGVFFVQSLVSRGALVDEKAGQFKIIALTNSLGQVVGLLAAIALLQSSASVWVIVFGQAVAALAYVIASAMAYRVKRPPRLDRTLLVRLLREGWPLLKLGVMTSITYNIDKLIVAVLISPSATGLYSLAQRIAEIPGLLYSTIVGRTLLPLYAASFQGGRWMSLRTQMQQLLRRVVAVFAVLSASSWLIVSSDAITLVPLQWREAAALVPLFLLGVTARSAVQTLSPAFLVVGRVQTDVRMKLQETACYMLGFPALVIAFEIEGAVVGFVMVYALTALRRAAFFRTITLPSKG